MIIFKYIILFIILLSSSLIGKFLSKKYVYRLQELEEMKNALNLFKTKAKFTYNQFQQFLKKYLKILLRIYHTFLIRQKKK